MRLLVENFSCSRYLFASVVVTQFSEIVKNRVIIYVSRHQTKDISKFLGIVVQAACRWQNTGASATHRASDMND